ncbi:MAG: FAD:protein FMN transferase, partial [Tepidiformaceae bacterium]
MVQEPGGQALPARLVMDTLVSIEFVGADERHDAGDAIERAFGWFYEVERRCSRFDPSSELRSLSDHVGEAVTVSGLLYQVVEFALAVAEASAGAFDPTVGGLLAANGFDRNYETGEQYGGDPGAGVTYKDVRLDPNEHTISLLRPLTLDLGAVAKGFAMDLAAAELKGFAHFAINAGGDLFLRGRNSEGEPWGV